MTARIQLTQPVYMPIDGQWQIVDIGSVIDVPANVTIALAHGTVLAETTKTLPIATSPTAVRNVRTR